MIELYTDRRDGPRPRTETAISSEAWRAFASLVRSRLLLYHFGHGFPQRCDDFAAPYGCDEQAFFHALRGVAEFPPLQAEFRGPDWEEPSEPPTDAILDGLEWCAGKIGIPSSVKYHDYMSHDHLRWDGEQGRLEWAREINQIMARQSLAYEMDPAGRIRRVVEGPGAQALARTPFRTGDGETDRLLEQARRRFFDRDADSGQDSIEALWDAFERLKSHFGSDKKASIEALLARAAADSAERDLIDAEMTTLTKIGNSWRIRHHETGKHALGEGRTLRDYLFLRMFALMSLLLARLRPCLLGTSLPQDWRFK